MSEGATEPKVPDDEQALRESLAKTRDATLATFTRRSTPEERLAIIGMLGLQQAASLQMYIWLLDARLAATNRTDTEESADE